MLATSPFLTFQHFTTNIRNDDVSVCNFAMNIRDDGTGFNVMANIGGGSVQIQWWGQ